MVRRKEAHIPVTIEHITSLIEQQEFARAEWLLLHARRQAVTDEARGEVLGLSLLCTLRSGGEAERALQAALDQHPGRPDLIRAMAVALSDAGALSLAEQAFRHLAAADPADLVAHYDLSLVLERASPW